MTRRVRFIKQNKGMTLVEIMTGFAILAVLMAVSLTIMLFATNALNKESERDRMKMSGDEMYQAVSGKLKFATHLELRPEGADPDAAKYENRLGLSGYVGRPDRRGRGRHPAFPGAYL